MSKPGVKEKLSILAKKRDHSHLWTKEAKLKQAKTISGKGHWNWQGGITPENRRRRNLAEYSEWRKTVFERDNYTCQFCGAKNGNGKNVYLQADHIKPWSTCIESRLDIDNGRTLCKPCHETTESYPKQFKK
jgi:formylmethanofuran dehydrogenase subunit E